MNNGKMIKRYFDFLAYQGFACEQYSNGTDYEVYYERGNIKIGICLELGFPNDVVKDYIKDGHYAFPPNFDTKKLNSEIAKQAYYVVDIVITKNGDSENILKHSLLGAMELTQLSKAITHCGQDFQKQLEIYSKFIKDNIDKII